MIDKKTRLQLTTLYSALLLLRSNAYEYHLKSRTDPGSSVKSLGHDGSVTKPTSVQYYQSSMPTLYLPRIGGTYQYITKVQPSTPFHPLGQKAIRVSSRNGPNLLSTAVQYLPKHNLIYDLRIHGLSSLGQCPGGYRKDDQGRCVPVGCLNCRIWDAMLNRYVNCCEVNSFCPAGTSEDSAAGGCIQYVTVKYPSRANHSETQSRYYLVGQRQIRVQSSRTDRKQQDDCPPGSTKDSKTERCIKKVKHETIKTSPVRSIRIYYKLHHDCPSGTTKDSETSRCIKNSNRNLMSTTTVPPDINDTPQSCYPGEVRDDESGKCFPLCPPGTKVDLSTGLCLKSPRTKTAKHQVMEVCSPGEIQDEDTGECFRLCPPGTTVDTSTGLCLRSPITKTHKTQKITPETCPLGMVRDDETGACSRICPIGTQVDFSTGLCLETPPLKPYMVSRSLKFNRGQCSSGEIRDHETGKCFPLCPPGTSVDLSMGICQHSPEKVAKNRKTKSCSPGEVINGKSGKCLPLCPPGATVDASTGICLKSQKTKSRKIEINPQPCYPGMVMDTETGECHQLCPPGSTVDLRTGACRKSTWLKFRTAFRILPFNRHKATQRKHIRE